MKELSIEEKAKRYDEALERARNLYKDAIDIEENIRAKQCTIIFPELAEPEGERIRESLIELFHDTVSNDEIFSDYGLDKTEVLAWLEKQDKQSSNILWHDVSEEPDEKREIFCEWKSSTGTWHSVVFYYADSKAFFDGEGMVQNVVKWTYVNEMLEKQGEQKPINKVEPKFKEGDWVFIEWDKGYKKGLFQIKNVDCFGYSFDEYFTIPFIYENVLSKWTIEDAEDGDVLCVNNEVFIYAHKKQMYSIAVAHCFVDSAGGFYLGGEFVYREYGKTICPATKEQRDLLFQKMKEAGYEWDADKKEPKNCKL